MRHGRVLDIISKDLPPLPARRPSTEKLQPFSSKNRTLSRLHIEIQNGIGGKVPLI